MNGPENTAKVSQASLLLAGTPHRRPGSGRGRFLALNTDSPAIWRGGFLTVTACNPPAGPRIEQVSSPSVKPAGIDLGEAAGDAAATEIAEPIADLATRMAGLFNGNGDNAPSAECIDEITGVLQAIEDPARIPSLLIEEAVTHVTRHFTAIILGPFGPAGLVVAIFVGKFAGELTHQALDSGRNPAAIQGAESAIELAGALADARIDRLAESDPFRQYVSGLVSRPIAAIINRDDAVSLDAASGHTVERVPDRRPPAVTAVIAAHRVRTPPAGAARSPGDSRTAPSVSFAVLECVPAEAVHSQWRHGSYEFLRLADGTVIKRRIGGLLPGQWVRANS